MDAVAGDAGEHEKTGGIAMNNYNKIKGMNLKELAKFLIELTGPGDTIKY